MASSSQNRPATATRGGASSISTPANSGTAGFFGWTSAAKSSGGGASKPDAPLDTKSTSSAAGARRQSQEGSVFGNLSNLKRNSQEQGATQRKASLSEQGVKPGVFGQMWNSFTKGTENK